MRHCVTAKPKVGREGNDGTRRAAAGVTSLMPPTSHRRGEGISCKLDQEMADNPKLRGRAESSAGYQPFEKSVGSDRTWRTLHPFAFAGTLRWW